MKSLSIVFAPPPTHPKYGFDFLLKKKKHRKIAIMPPCLFNKKCLSPRRVTDSNGWVSSRFPTVCAPQIHDPRVMNM